MFKQVYNLTYEAKTINIKFQKNDLTYFGRSFVLASSILIHFLSLFIKLWSLVDPGTLKEKQTKWFTTCEYVNDFPTQ